MGALMFMNFDDLMMDFAKDQNLGNWEIIVASHEICGSLKLKSAISGVSTGINYESKYDNIEFVNSLRPTASIMEYSYDSGSGRAQFIERYQSHLLGSEPFMDLCSIVDMVVNNDTNVMIVMAGYECGAKIPDYLCAFIEEQFDVSGFMYSDLKRLSDHIGNPTMYAKIKATVPFDVPDEFTGRNFEVILNHPIENLEKVKENLELQKKLAADMSADPGTENDLTSMFFNRFTEDLETKLKELLMKRSDDDIKDLCRTKKIRIAHGASKEFLINKILHTMKLDSVREIEYMGD